MFTVAQRMINVYEPVGLTCEGHVLRVSIWGARLNGAVDWIHS